MSRYSHSHVSFLLLPGLLLACSDATDPEPGPGPEPAQKIVPVISIDQPADTLNWLGAQVELSASVVDSVTGSSIDTATVEWSSTNSAILSINQFGLLTGRLPGRGRIIASVRGANTADTVEITVRQIAREISIGAGSHPVGPRAAVRYPAIATDSGGSVIERPEISWESSNASIARIRSDGVALFGSEGTVTIRARSGNGLDSTVVNVGQYSGSGEFAVWSSDDVRLVGELDLPPGDGPFPAVMRAWGSNPANRTFGNSASSTLVPAGFGILRSDKRGVGESEGFYIGIGVAESDTMIPLLADDVITWVELLANHSDIDTAKIGLLGVSQGGWINPSAAERSPHVRFMINVIGPVISFGQQILYQNLTQADNLGRNTSGLSDEELFQRVRDYNGPPGFDPQPILRRIDVPAIWILANKDYQVPYAVNVEIIEDIVADTGKDYSYFTLDNAVHSTVDIDTRQPVPWWNEPGGGFEWLDARGFMP